LVAKNMAATLHPPYSPDLVLQFFLASKNEGTVPDIHKQLLIAPQAVPKKVSSRNASSGDRNAGYTA
jgi:hypothetical protein